MSRGVDQADGRRAGEYRGALFGDEWEEERPAGTEGKTLVGHG